MELFLLFYFLSSYGKFASAVYSKDAYFAVHGKITSFDDLFESADKVKNAIQGKDDHKKIENELLRDYPTNLKFNVKGFIDTNLNETGDDHAYDEFVKISRRQLLKLDEEDEQFGLLEEELKKEFKVRKIILSFLMYTKHELEKAFRQREEYRQDKRYKLGYLFNKLRRIKTEQMKLVSVVLNRKIQEEFLPDPIREASLFVLLVYEKIAAYDVDIRDISFYIKDLHKNKAPSDYVIQATQIVTS